MVKAAEWIQRRFLPVQYDATRHPAELYYASIYLERINRHLADADRQPLKILDVGFGTGRLLIPLAVSGHRLAAIEHHRDSLRFARQNARESGVNVEWRAGAFEKELDRIPHGSFDAVMAIEVLYVNREPAAILGRLARRLRSGGLSFVSHRTCFYYITQCLAQGRFEDAFLVTTHPEGRLVKGHHRIYYNWQSWGELEDMYAAAGLKILSKYPIGPLSGFGADPMRAVADPGQLSGKEQDWLRKIELRADPEMLMASRYVFVVAQK